MKRSIDDGGPAFPGFQHTEGHGPMRRGANDNWEVHSPGLSLRDYFAAQALIGICTTGEASLPEDDKAARWAYEYADAMIAARKAEPSP